jgi:beta-glucanase (GH16 family)
MRAGLPMADIFNVVICSSSPGQHPPAVWLVEEAPFGSVAQMLEYYMAHPSEFFSNLANADHAGAGPDVVVSLRPFYLAGEVDKRASQSCSICAYDSAFF